MKIITILIFCSALLTACSGEKDFTNLKGTWRTDSVYTYYNGVTFTRHDVSREPLHHYGENNSLIMKKDGEKRSFLYTIGSPDTLTHRDRDHRALQSFIVLDINKEKLALKRNLNPLFPGSNQSRYEIWYFSKVDN